jgi:hypothetical protein
LVWADVVARWAIPKTSELQVAINTSQLLTIGIVLVGISIAIEGAEATAVLAYVLSEKPQGVELGDLAYLWERQPETVMKAPVDLLTGGLLVWLGSHERLRRRAAS